MLKHEHVIEMKTQVTILLTSWTDAFCLVCEPSNFPAVHTKCSVFIYCSFLRYLSVVKCETQLALVSAQVVFHEIRVLVIVR